ncbi:MAG: hypothetical protein ACTH07_06955 [Microbacterium sp.]
MRRLGRFANAHGFQFAVEPSAARRAASFFRRSDGCDAVAWLGVPGGEGFEVAQHIERVNTGGPEPSETRQRWTWAVFSLRMTDQGPAVISTVLSAATERFLLRGWRHEIVGTELFLVTTRFTSLTSRRMWRMLRDIQRALHPVLAQPERTSDLAERQRNGVRREIAA